MKNTQNQSHSKVQKDEVKRKSPFVFIQLGLVLALLVVFFALEAKTEIRSEIVSRNPTGEVPLDDFPPEMSTEPLDIQKPKPEVDLGKLVIIADDVPLIENTVVTTENDPDKGITITKIIDIIKTAKIIEPEVYDIKQVSEAPIFPGCKGDNEEIKKCFADNVRKFVNQKFDTSLSEGLSLSGLQRISVQFIVDKTGNISDIQVRAPHNSLKKEAERVINLLPKMTPGKRQFEPVKVKYTLPIVFEIPE